MHKKLKKYIDRYDHIQHCKSYALIPNGGMILLLNQHTSCEVLIDDNAYSLKAHQAVLINAYETSVTIASDEMLECIVIRFRGAGASFFYEASMDRLMQYPNEPIYIEEHIAEDTLDSYLLNRLTPSKLPFNIMKIIDLLDEQGSGYSIDEILAIANIPRKSLDKMFNLRTGLTFKAYASLQDRYAITQ